MNKSALLGDLYTARFDDLKDMAGRHELPKTGPVEALAPDSYVTLFSTIGIFRQPAFVRYPMPSWARSWAFSVSKNPGSIKARRQRLYLHLNHDPKSLSTDTLDAMTKEELHAMCKKLELPLSGNKQSLLARVAGVLASQENAWGKVKKSLRRPKTSSSMPSTSLPVPTEGNPAADESPTPAETYAFDLDVEEAEPATVADVPPLASTVPPMIQHVETPEIYSLEIETALMELRERLPEIRAFARDFLMVSSTTNVDDMDAFILSLRAQGFATDHPPVHQAVAKRDHGTRFPNQKRIKRCNRHAPIMG